MHDGGILDTALITAIPLKIMLDKLGGKAYNLVLNELEVSGRGVKLEIVYPRELDDVVKRVVRGLNLFQASWGIDGFLARVRGVTGGLLLQTRQDKTYIIDPDTGIILLTIPRIRDLTTMIGRIDPVKYLDERAGRLGGLTIRFRLEEPETLTTTENIRLIYITEIVKPGEVVEEAKPLVSRATSSLLVIAPRRGFRDYNRFIGKGFISFINASITRELIKRILLLLVTSGFRNLFYVETPLLAKRELYEETGHLRHFSDRIYSVHGRSGEYLLRPMNCPHHLVVMKTILERTPDPGGNLPLATYEYGVVFRDEPTGTLEPLIRVRQFTLDDLHVLAPEGEANNILEKLVTDIFYTYSLLGVEPGNIEAVIGVHDPNNPGKYLFTELGVEARDQWVGLEEDILSPENIGGIMDKVSERLGLEHKPVVLRDRTAAFYGPKIDFYYTGRSRYTRLATIQLDVSLPRIFKLDGLTGIDRLLLVHSAIAGSLERFMGILLEENNILHPVLAPIQVLIVFHEELLGDEEVREVYLGLGRRLYNEWIRALTISMGLKRIGALKTTAIKLGIPYLVVIGPRELGERNIRIQDLRSNREVYIGVGHIAELPDKLVDALNNIIYGGFIDSLEKYIGRRIDPWYLKHPYTPPSNILLRYKG